MPGTPIKDEPKASEPAPSESEVQPSEDSSLFNSNDENKAEAKTL